MAANASTSWNKTIVIIDYTKKLPELTLGRWLWIILDTPSKGCMPTLLT